MKPLLPLAALAVIALGAAPVETPPSSPSPIRLEVRPLSGRRYEMSLTNDSDAATPVFVDRHLLYFELDPDPRPAAAPATVPALAKATRSTAPVRPPTIGCSAAPDGRPTEVRRHQVRELAARQSVRETFDLRSYCWASRGKLSAGYTLRGYYGFGRPRTGAIGPASAPRRPVAPTARRWVARGTAEIAAPAVRHEAEPEAPSTLVPPPPGSPEAAAAAPFVLSGRDVDIAAGPHFAVALTLRNRSTDSEWLYVRPDLFHFEVLGIAGGAECRTRRLPVNPIRDLFARLGPRGERTTALDMAAFCEADTFARPGVYELTPIFDAAYDGRNVSLDAWTGVVRGKTVVVRVRAGTVAAYVANPPAAGSP